MIAGHFIEPDTSLAELADPAAKLGIQIYSGYNAVGEMFRLRGQNKIFDMIHDRLVTLSLPYEDQCSSQYYFDIFRTLRDFNGEFDRVVEVGVYMGGSSGILAGCSEAFDFDLDLVDISAPCLRFAHERIRRMFPDAAKRVRLFHGDLPSYVHTVMMEEKKGGAIIHHDGAHDFNQVVKDMASLSFVKEQLYAVIAQDTHLRGTAKEMNFVDMAIYAVFGTDLNYIPIGAHHPASSPLTAPNQYQGNYFAPDAYEGIVIPMAVNSFRYPHPSLPIEDFLSTPPAKAEEANPSVAA